MNNIDTARKRTVTSVATGKERKRKAPEQRKLSLYTQEKLKINVCETTN